MRILFTPITSIFLILYIAVSAISIALASEYWGGLIPCELCLQQRWAYYGAITVLLVALGLVRVRESWAMKLLAIAVLILAAGGMLAFYHAGAEYGFWAAPVACTGVAAPLDTIDHLLESLTQPVLPSCAQAAWQLFGISMAGYNVLASFILVFYGGWSIWRYWREQ